MNELRLQSTITCPACGTAKEETMPSEYCQIRYTCEHCQTELQPRLGDCCVYCSYGSVKCPSMQDVAD